jgi:hypothetical protein
MMVRVAFCCTLGSLLQDSGRVHTQDAELAPSAELLKARVAEDMTGRSLPDIDNCVLAHKGMLTQIDAYGRRIVDLEQRRALGRTSGHSVEEVISAPRRQAAV